MPKKIDLTRKLHREFTIDRGDVDEKNHTIEVSFSSEEPYERGFGSEVLDHEPQSVRLDRLNGGGAVLVNHDNGDQVGVVDSARIDDDKKGRAVIRFSRSKRGKEIQNDVSDGIRKLVSVGYRILGYDVTEREGMSDLVRVTDWEPYEISLVPVPADSTVGVGRNIEDGKMPEAKKIEKTPEVKIEAPDVGKIQRETREAEMTRINQIRAMGEKSDLDSLAADAIKEGWTYADFNEKALAAVGERNNAARSETKHDGDVDLSKKDHQEFSLVRVMEAAAFPNDRSAQQRAAFELEVSDAATKGFGSEFQARGIYVPESALTRDLSAGTATDGAELVATNLLAGSFVDVLRNSMATQQMGVRMLPGLVGDVAIPRKTSGASMTWISAEDGDATEGEPQFDQITLSPKDAGCFTEVTRRLFQQATPAIEGIVRDDLAQAIGLGLDLAILDGTGSSGQPTGISATTGINVKDLAAADPTYLEIVEIVKLVLEDNALLGNLGWIIDPNGWEALQITPKQGSGVEGNFIMSGDTIMGYPTATSAQVTAEEYFFGNWSDVLVGEWGGLELNVDPYTNALKGRIRFIIFKTVDIAVRHPESFCHAHDGIA